jgi:Bacterial Ig domain
MMHKNLRVPIWVLTAALAGGISRGGQGPVTPQASLPIVSVQASDPLASEPGNNPGSFTLSRAGDTNASLTVTFSLGGTASNGVDYAAVPTSITLAAGQISSNLSITPRSEPASSGYKTVMLTLPQVGFGRQSDASAFRVGALNRALIYIVYNYTNVPPSVSLVSPGNASSFFSRPNITLTATASDSNGWVTSVQFLANTSTLGVVSNHAFGPFALPAPALGESQGSLPPMPTGRRSDRFQFVWTNVAPGLYTLTAVATDNAGLQTTSTAADIQVTTNLPVPSVRIINPANEADFADQAPINFYAAAGETNGVVDKVEFFANGSSLGTATNYLAGEPMGQVPFQRHWLLYYLRWTNAPAGSNVLTAVATDNNGSKAVSAPVNINVTTNLYHRHHAW